MTSIAQLIKTSDYACTGRYPVQASAMFLNELSISLSLQLPRSQKTDKFSLQIEIQRDRDTARKRYIETER